MNQSDMLLQMVYSMVQSAQSTRPTQAAQTQNNGTQKSDDGKDFQTLLEEKRTELDGQTVEQPVENGEEPKDDVPADVLAQAMVLSQMTPVPPTVVVAEEVQPQAAEVSAAAVAPVVPEAAQNIQVAVPEENVRLAQTSDGVVVPEEQSVEPMAQTLPEQPAEKTEAPSDTGVPAEEVLSTPQTKQDAAPQTKEESGGQEQGAPESGKTVQTEDYEVLSAQTGAAERPLFQETETLPQRVGDAPVMDTQAEDMDSRLAEKLTKTLLSGEQRLELKLTPEHLGNVVVEMSRTPEGVLHVILHTENEQAARLLSEHSSTLGMMLQNSQQNEVRIEVQQPNQSEQPWQHPDQDGGQSGQDGRQQQERRQQTDPERFLQQLRLGLTGTDG